MIFINRKNMSAAEETIRPKEVFRPKPAPIVNRTLDSLSAVRLGVFVLCVLVVLSMIGMLIMQQNVQGFETYYPSLTPAEKLVFGYLGFFDIYHSWYFNLLLLFLSLNIILASIDRFPSAWRYIVDPKTTGTRDWLMVRKQNTVLSSYEGTDEDVAKHIKTVFERNGLKTRITESNNSYYDLDEFGNKIFDEIKTKRQLCVFGESGKWNRLGAYVVHVSLLTLFLGHFVALRTGFDADVRLTPGEKTDQIQMLEFNLDKKERYNVKLPFSLDCTDIQQRLIDPNGSIDVTNTLDWRTQVKIDDPEYGVTTADVSLNKPLNYRGYRFFQAQTIPIGNARTITLDLTPQNGEDPLKIEIARNGSTTLADGTKVAFADFLPDFTMGGDGKPATKSGEYNNPAAVLNVTTPAGEKVRVFAFAAKLADNIPVGAPKAGYKWRLADFEKSPLAHVLSIKYDPFNGAFIAWYFGGFGLIGALMFVFFFSHKRVWAMIDKSDNDRTEVVVAGEANRNNQGFEDKFNKIADDLITSVT